MKAKISKRSKINLSDYNYERDIKNRLLMATFSVFEVDLIDNILNSSLIVKIEDLALEMEATSDYLMPFLEKLLVTELFKITGSKLEVSKEMRKYYEFQIKKFDDDFESNMEFIREVLRKVPIGVLPAWYSIPKTADNILVALIDKYFASPMGYKKYIRELRFEDDLLNKITLDIFEQGGRRLSSDSIREKYQISREQFELYMLHLEFNFVGYLLYEKDGDNWHEVIKPFYEWKVYLDNEALVVNELADSDIELLYQEEDNFLEDMRAVVKYLQEHTIGAVMVEGCYRTSPEECSRLTSLLKRSICQEYLDMLINKLSLLKLIKEDDKYISIEEDNLKEFNNIDDEELAIYLLRYRRGAFFNFDIDSQLAIDDNNQRNIIKSLSKLLKCEWMYLKTFLRSIEFGIGKARDIHLAREGRHWKYIFPKHSESEENYIKAVVLERAFQSGLLQIGELNGEKCIRLTDLGKSVVIKS